MATHTTRPPVPSGIACPAEVRTRLGTLRFFDGFPDDATVRTLYENLDFQRAVQAYLLGLAPVDMATMRTALSRARRTPRRRSGRTWSTHTQTRSMLQTGQEWPSVTSQDQDLTPNEDGSVDIHFGPEPPDTGNRNWIQTLPGKGWFTMFRLYGPLEPWFDKTWRLPDITRLTSGS